MLKSLELKNIESHKSTKINFHPGVNTIVGDSDSGKSAIMRALELLFYNKPRGDDFRSDWGGESRIIARFIEGEGEDVFLSRIRGSSKNQYILTLDGEEESFSGFGAKIPDTVADYINMNEVNLLIQDEPLFMIQWSPGQRGEFINKMCNFRLIDSSLTSINRTVKQTKAMKDQNIELLDGYQEALEEFEDLDDLEADLERVEGLDRSLRKLREESKDLSDLIYNIASQKKRLREYETFLKRVSDLSPLEALKLKIESEWELIYDLEEDIETINLKEKRAAQYNENIEKYREAYKKALPNICPICEQEVPDEKRLTILSERIER